MIKSVTITNYLQESVKIELTEPESSGFIIRSIEGLGPAKANLNFTELAALDGALDNGAALLDTRNIVLSLIFVGTPTIEDTRLKSYKYFPIKQNLTFEIETDNRHCFTVGRVESNVPTIFGTDREGCQISILCPNSYFQDMEDTVKEFYSVEGGFEFPFENNSVERMGKNLIFLEMLRWRMNGLTFDIRPNNVVNVIGAATRNTRIAITETITPLTSGNSYRLSGCPSYGGNSRFRLEVWDNNGNLKASDTGSGVTFTASSSETHIVKILVLATYEINDTFKPILEPVVNDVSTGSDLLKMADVSIVRADNVEFDIINDGTIHVFGTYSQIDGPIELWLSRISNIENDHEYILSGCPENEDEEDPQYELCVEGMDGVERAIDVGSGVTFQKTNDQEFDTLKLKLGFPVNTGTNIPEGEELDLTFRPMIRDSSIEDPTFESPHVMTDSGAMLEFSNVERHFTDNIFYDGDSEVGIVAEIHSSGSVSDLAIYKPETNEMIRLSNSKLVQILGEGIKDGDIIYVSTVKGNKYVRILRNGVYYNVLNALVKPITWLNLRRGDNVFSVTALSGESNLLFKISYRKTYEGV